MLVIPVMFFPGLGQVVDKLVADRVGDGHEDDRDRGGGPLDGQRRRPGHGDQDIDLQLGQLGGEADERRGLLVGEPILQSDVLPFDVAEVQEPLP